MKNVLLITNRKYPFSSGVSIPYFTFNSITTILISSVLRHNYIHRLYVAKLNTRLRKSLSCFQTISNIYS